MSYRPPDQAFLAPEMGGETMHCSPNDWATGQKNSASPRTRLLVDGIWTRPDSNPAVTGPARARPYHGRAPAGTGQKSLPPPPPTSAHLEQSSAVSVVI